MKIIKKEIYQPRFTSKKYMLLGVRSDKKKVWMEQASFDCDWYFGFGYLEVMNHPRTDINEHYHFESFYQKNKNAFDAFKEAFVCSTVTEKELWVLCDLMKTFYTLKDVSELYHNGNSHYTTTPISLKNEAKYKETLEEQKQIILAVQKLLGLNEEENKIL
jgi:hypothetical protein